MIRMTAMGHCLAELGEPDVETYSDGALIIIGLAISNEVIKFGAIGSKNLTRAGT